MTQATLRLGPELGIAQAASVREQLLAVLATAPSRLELDLGEVSDFDSAGVQLLLATRRALAEHGAQLHLSAASAPVRRALELFGLEALLLEGAPS